MHAPCSPVPEFDRLLSENEREQEFVYDDTPIANLIMMIHAIKSTIDWSQARRTTCALPDDHHRDLGWPVIRSGIAAFADHG